ncbi:hypothetical protein A2X44_04850 [candidate division CPR3 bacterium GWF2_35_18]|uniref:FecR protein domain-containing protein n=1 Tax=candidate division CPR3 bacterium GW2011_GWF2_35_18 TaxID=1618350 RepID=A0A0G0BK14_UNCC3|nr:MAG: hypothetical protein UR67_C0003G0051 [candidate division CPR3 bacterium GW2011_GWF2_35_18]KKP86919.1 MAG: hypothetical protein UR87_C0008G0010 [candidate division CPR3 bacterium GW2011_GWE2_35_7]OGB63662.1 MAG: hypothetical protein A2X44_04850 [candidate division CPR3 bacterium GWF2_35_18]OGB65017.1 MAG: hypothetical protein A2250_01190 [candidate division CPR3 bacterium RIFOXYA2_FULL_35_13]OGB76017.1 MAG: hypothetical protein A2476_02140 [candidate division CPR3 bacterium RIFOXYC2_FULL
MNKEDLTLHGLFAKSKLSDLKENQLSDQFQDDLKDQLIKVYLKPKGGFFMNLKEKIGIAPFSAALATSLIMVLFVAGLSIYNLTANKSSFSHKLKANVLLADGDVLYKTSGTDRWIELKVDDVLSEGDSVKTSAASRTILELDDGGAIRLQEETEITLTSMTANEVLITEESGESYHRVAKSESREYTVKAGDLEATAQGTAYTVSKEEKNITVNVIESKVKLNKNNTEISEGEKATFEIESEKLAIEEISKDSLKNDDFLVWNKEKDEENGEDTGILDDITAPEIIITSPTENTTTEETITIKGTTEKEALIKVNGEITENKEGNFEEEVALTLGENIITIMVKDQAYNTATKELKIIRNAQEQEQEENNGETQNQEENENQNQNGSISLNGKANQYGMNLSWTVTNLDVTKGFKVVKSETGTPTYPGSDYSYLSGESKTNPYTYTWSVKDGKTYNVRVCQYDGNGACGVYSNMITITTIKEVEEEKEEPVSQVTSIVLSGTGKNVSWVATGEAQYGFKVVWSKNTNPVYPNRQGDKYHYYNNPETSTDVLEAFSGNGKYYVRVCEYLLGKCGTYSNQIQVTL